jgi:hypothetical protein
MMSRAELAVADHGERRLLAMPPAQILPYLLERDLEDEVGERGKVVGQALDGEQAGEVLRQQAEHRRLVRLAQQVHALLDILRGRELYLEVFSEGRKIGGRVQQPVVEQLVEQQRVAGDELRRPARGADDARHALQRLGMLGEQREVGGAAGDRLDQVHAARQRGVGVGRSARRACQRRRQTLEAALGLGR